MIAWAEVRTGVAEAIFSEGENTVELVIHYMVLRLLYVLGLMKLAP